MNDSIAPMATVKKPNFLWFIFGPLVKGPMFLFTFILALGASSGLNHILYEAPTHRQLIEVEGTYFAENYRNKSSKYPTVIKDKNGAEHTCTCDFDGFGNSNCISEIYSINTKKRDELSGQHVLVRFNRLENWPFSKNLCFEIRHQDKYILTFEAASARYKSERSVIKIIFFWLIILVFISFLLVRLYQFFRRI